MSTYRSSRKAIEELRAQIGPVTGPQMALVEHLGLKIELGLPKIVAAARLHVALASHLCMSADNPTSESALQFLADLNPQKAADVRVADSQAEAAAWIRFFLLERRIQCLERLGLEAGDIVELRDSGGVRLAEMISIGGDGRVYFRGGQNLRAWPDLIALRCRKDDNSPLAREYKKEAANQAATRSNRFEWSSAKDRELREFRVDSAITHEAVDELERVVDKADDEKPIQRFLEDHPQLLVGLLGGNSRFLVPRPQLGSNWVPDFFLADVDSLGVRWLLVELETPVSTVTLQGENVLERHARKGVSQVEEWRHWIMNNLDLARRPRRDSGLGLIDIRPQSEGLVLVGRRARLFENARMVRHPFRENSRIRVHTYDWLIEQLRGGLNFSGPPGSNPYLIQPLRIDDPKKAVLLGHPL